MAYNDLCSSLTTTRPNFVFSHSRPPLGPAATRSHGSRDAPAAAAGGVAATPPAATATTPSRRPAAPAAGPHGWCDTDADAAAGTAN